VTSWGVRMSGCWCTSAKNTSESETLHSVAASALHPHIVGARIRLEECVELSRQAETFSRPRTMPAMERTRGEAAGRSDPVARPTPGKTLPAGARTGSSRHAVLPFARLHPRPPSVGSLTSGWG
jgi:hypothetical protein